MRGLKGANGFVFAAVVAAGLCRLSAAQTVALAAGQRLFSVARPAMGTTFEIHLYEPDEERFSVDFEF